MGLVVSDFNKLDDTIVREICKLKRKLLAREYSIRGKGRMKRGHATLILLVPNGAKFDFYKIEVQSNSIITNPPFKQKK